MSMLYYDRPRCVTHCGARTTSPGRRKVPSVSIHWLQWETETSVSGAAGVWRWSKVRVKVIVLTRWSKVWVRVIVLTAYSFSQTPWFSFFLVLFFVQKMSFSGANLKQGWLCFDAASKGRVYMPPKCSLCTIIDLCCFYYCRIVGRQNVDLVNQNCDPASTVWRSHDAYLTRCATVNAFVGLFWFVACVLVVRTRKLPPWSWMHGRLHTGTYTPGEPSLLHNCSPLEKEPCFQNTMLRNIGLPPLLCRVQLSICSQPPCSSFPQLFLSICSLVAGGSLCRPTKCV